ncbi:MAG TPA: hypothetical protein VLL95_12150 [Phnomibacter sp.]|nr:hypothetical protein [Phnomibacter sp.]
MNKDSNMQQWVDGALESIDGLPRAQANPFLFTRIQERLRQRNSPWEKVASFVARPAFAVAIVVAFLSVNLYVANRQKEERLAREKQTNEQMFAAEYNTGSSLQNELLPNR